MYTGPSMSSRLEDTAALVLEKYDGDLEKLREAANKDPEEIRKLVKEFKVKFVSPTNHLDLPSA